MSQLKNRFRIGIFGLLTLLFVSTNSLSQNIFSIKANQQIWEAKDRNDIVYTKYILKKGTKQQKILTLNGLQSWHDNSLRKPLIKLIKRGDEDVKIAALQAIGQSRDSFYIPYLIKIINHRKKQGLKPAALVSLGKCITKSKVNKLVKIKNINQPGYTECIYRALLKGAGCQELTDSMVKLFRKPENFYVFWYFARSPYPINSAQFEMHYKLFSEGPYNTNITIPMFIGLAKAKVNKADSIKIRQIFIAYLSNTISQGIETHYLRSTSIYRALAINGYSFSYDELYFKRASSEMVYPPLELNISELISKKCKAYTEYPYLTYGPAIVNLLKNTECNTKLKLPLTNTIYDKIWNLQLLENAYQNYPTINTILMQTDQPAVKSAAMESLIKCRNSKGFPENLISDFNETVSILIKDADEGALSIIANAILDKQISIEPNYKDLFIAAQAKLKLPQEMEAYIDIAKVLAMINKTVYQKPLPEWNNPIDWKHVGTITSAAKIKVSTNKGYFIIQMNVNEAPGSVSSILKLVESGFYNGKYFHRMVPNFVLQGGCPRGDGFGGVNYTIRSEFSATHQYTTGAVGLASAGPDTESCQWFVTHCPTPHLDGRYTIIGHVIQGMDVVHKLGVGDVMIKVERL